ncbi:MAG: hypothetical protein KAG61_05130, partial [Bacteriovoracaceae bacterium]|nr:hypothetical protein [Bacteriovoracaceae bacterium]
MNNIVIILIIFLMLSGCGKPDDTTEREIAVETSYILMSRGNCQGAIDILNSVTQSNTDAKFLQAKSLAYACRAGYSTVKLFGSDLGEFASAPSFINGFVNFSTSSLRVEVDDNNFNDLQEAIDILLYAGGIKATQQPTSARRAQFFSKADLGEIDAQLTYMIMVQLGMYFRYYGNVDAAGTKG